MPKRLRKNITTKDITCNCGCGFRKMSPAILDITQMLRDHFKEPIHINSRNHSGARCKSHNSSVGGDEDSMHLPDEITKLCRGVDVGFDNVSPKKVYKFLDQRFPNCLGLGLYKTHVHVDDRMMRAFRWNRTKKK